MYLLDVPGCLFAAFSVFSLGDSAKVWPLHTASVSSPLCCCPVCCSVSTQHGAYAGFCFCVARRPSPKKDVLGLMAHCHTEKPDEGGEGNGCPFHVTLQFVMKKWKTLAWAMGLCPLPGSAIFQAFPRAAGPRARYSMFVELDWYFFLSPQCAYHWAYLA